MVLDPADPLIPEGDRRLQLFLRRVSLDRVDLIIIVAEHIPKDLTGLDPEPGSRCATHLIDLPPDRLRTRESYRLILPISRHAPMPAGIDSDIRECIIAAGLETGLHLPLAPRTGDTPMDLMIGREFLAPL